VTKARAAELEEQQGFKPGRKQMRELKEQVTDELLPRAFSIRRDTRVWIDCRNGWLVIDAASQAVADEVRGLLVKSVDQLPLGTVRVAQSPVAAMTEWLLSGDGPAGFTVDQDTELRSPTEGNATVRYVGHTLDAEDMRRHIEAGKQCMRLAMTWKDRVSFVLTPSLTIKRIAPLDVLKEAGDPTAQNDDERFDSDFTLMTAELDKMLGDLLDALGGEQGEGMLRAA
jgi:recombination associated protein RdgC